MAERMDFEEGEGSAKAIANGSNADQENAEREAVLSMKFLLEELQRILGFAVVGVGFWGGFKGRGERKTTEEWALEKGIEFMAGGEGSG